VSSHVLTCLVDLLTADFLALFARDYPGFAPLLCLSPLRCMNKQGRKQYITGITKSLWLQFLNVRVYFSPPPPRFLPALYYFFLMTRVTRAAVAQLL
jgi:hypothetical protein